MVDPLNSIQLTTERARDVHHFFEKKKGESTICIFCRDWKASDPEKFPNHIYIYTPRTANSGLRRHIEKYYILLFLEQAEKHGWLILIKSVESAFSMGYISKSLRCWPALDS
ncbi:hypothetical protein JVT61DRAFT_7904 [Boletus reticuloceps]|uniref:Uncharacterized protein n=1 Tax=Boletus reticuloceps TaxID=495285 RepID=A0A8I3A790_9AGAM|nr:hypothetical protein JVT61DRAFT_7904 [Boletus reticuloceps]